MGMEEAKPKQSRVDRRAMRRQAAGVRAQRASRLHEVSREEKEPCLEGVRGELG